MIREKTILAREFLQESFNLSFLTPDEIDTIVKAMNLYAIGKCREQKQLCVEADKAINAPEPQFDL